MTYQEYADKQIADARKHFEEHVANFVEIKGEHPIQILDWRMASGDCWYHVRYLFDPKGGTITISGDLGWAVVVPTWRADFQSTVSVGVNPHYFLEKVRATSDRYEYDREEVEKGLTEKFKELREEWSEEKKEDWFDDLEYDVDNVMSCFDHAEGFKLCDATAIKTLNFYDDRYYEWLYSLGRHYHGRIWLWLVGLKMANEQLEAAKGGKEGA